MENNGKNHYYETESVMEIDILCLLSSCHLLASDFAELVFVLQTFIFGRGIAEYQPFQQWDGNG